MAIHFFKENIQFKLNHRAKLSDWILEVILSEQFQIHTVNYIFCSDDYLLELNRKFLKHNYLTDVITFNHSEETGVIEADIFISIDRVKENASKFAIQFHDELHRVMIHGILHLMGYTDKSKAAQHTMRTMEDKCLTLRSF